ncbi:hypothetical protein ABZZ79_32505 [Streptomyces sp. NPDC006458]|uniref:hypothetical protein n=1 Tax=Streptomyces sp. NPDC006458 TaxID=3154302 RepID=UPI00339EDD07
MAAAKAAMTVAVASTLAAYAPDRPAPTAHIASSWKRDVVDQALAAPQPDVVRQVLASP